MQIVRATAHACPGCAFEQGRLCPITPDYTLMECLRCGLQWDPAPDARTPQSYERNYYLGGTAEHGYADYERHMLVGRKTFARRLKKLKKRYGVTGRLLDIGCALGQCLIEAKALGWKDPQGCEISAHAQTVCTAKGLSVSLAASPIPKLAPAHYQVILLQDVIEHTTRVRELLSAVRHALVPGGVALIVTPDTYSWTGRALGKRWYHYKPGEHFTYFNRDNLALAVATSGLKVVRCEAATTTVSLEYFVERCARYSPHLAKLLLSVLKALGLARIPLSLRAGEIEIWAEKPKDKTEPVQPKLRLIKGQKL